MAMYKQINDDTLILSQQAIYGSSRLGVLERDEIVSIDSTIHTQTPTIPDPLTEHVTHWTRGHKRYELTNHLGNVLATVSDRKIPVYANNNFSYYKAEVMTANDYYAFGMVEPKRGFDTSDYRFAFGGHEKDNEVHGEGNWYTFGDYGYDPRIVQRPSKDPLSSQYPYQSPYAPFNGNPLFFTDPTGQSGEAVIDKNNKTITVTQHLIFYGGKAETKLSNKIATGIASQWNGAHGNVVMDGVKYNVKFRVTYETVTEAKATKMAETNTDIKNNFVRVEDGEGTSFTQKLGANSFYFNTDDDLGGSTTPAHEIGHGLGLNHSDEGGQTKDDVPDIMEARNTPVHPRWSKIGPSNSIDPNFRRVDKKEVKAIFSGVKFDKNGVGKIGTTTNKIYDKNGN